MATHRIQAELDLLAEEIRILTLYDHRDDTEVLITQLKSQVRDRELAIAQWDSHHE